MINMFKVAIRDLEQEKNAILNLRSQFATSSVNTKKIFFKITKCDLEHDL